MREGEVTVSPKGHCNLTGVRTQDHTFYLGREDPDGTIHLVPAALVPARLLQQPAEVETGGHYFPPGWRKDLL